MLAAPEKGARRGRRRFEGLRDDLRLTVGVGPNTNSDACVRGGDNYQGERSTKAGDLVADRSGLTRRSNTSVAPTRHAAWRNEGLLIGPTGGQNGGTWSSGCPRSALRRNDRPRRRLG